MLASVSLSLPALLLLASVAVAQEEMPSVATSPFVSPTPSEVQTFTIQTQTTGAPDPWACYEDCIQPPCPPCSSGSHLSIPPIPMPTPIPESVATAITDPGLSTVSGIMSIPPGETPISSGPVETSVASSEAPQVTTNAAVMNAKADGVSFVAAIAGALAFL